MNKDEILEDLKEIAPYTAVALGAGAVGGVVGYAGGRNKTKRSRASKKTKQRRHHPRGRVWKNKVSGKLDFFEKKGTKRGGVSLKAIRAMLKNPKTPVQLKKYWRAKMKMRGR